MSIVLDGTTGITTPGLTNTGTETLVNLTTTGNTILGDASTDTLNVGNGGLIKDASGNVGIGVTPSTWSLGKIAQIGTTTALWNDGSNNTYLTTNAYYNSGFKYLTSGLATSYVQSTTFGTHTWSVAPTGTAGNPVTLTTAMTLDASGILGLGVTPSTWSTGKVIQIGTTGAAIADGSGSMYWMNNTYYNSGWKYLTSTGASYYVQAGNAHQWHVAPSGTAGNAITFTQAMTLDASGNLVVGATSAPSSRYRIGFANASLGGIFGTATGGSDAQYVSSSAGIGYHFYAETSSGVSKFYVLNSGAIYSTSTTITAISDIRQKENVRDLETGLAEVLALRPRRFDWKENCGTGDKDVAGFIAQEVETVLPDLVNEWSVGLDSQEKLKALAMGNMLPTLVKAIQEQQALIQTLTDRITALENK